MTVRALVLRCMFGSLFVACGTAILSVIFLDRSSEIPWILVGTSMVIAVACALLLPVIPRGETQPIFLSGKVWIGVIAVVSLCALVLIWGNYLSIGFTMNQSIAFTVLIVLVEFGLVILPLKQLERAPSAITPVALLTTTLLAITVVCFSVSFLALGWSRASPGLIEQLLGAWLTATCASIALSCCAYGLLRGARLWRRIVAIVGATATVVAVGCWLQLIFSPISTPFATYILSWAFMLSSIAAASAILSSGNALALGKIESRLVPWIAVLTIVVGWLAAHVTSNSNSQTTLEWDTRLLNASAILGACLGLTVILLHRTSQRSATKSWKVVGAEVNCPRCGKKSTFSSGRNPCRSCGFEVLLAFRDAKCARCHYDVRVVRADDPAPACPECGLAIERSADNYLAAGAASGTSAGDHTAINA